MLATNAILHLHLHDIVTCTVLHGMHSDGSTYHLRQYTTACARDSLGLGVLEALHELLHQRWRKRVQRHQRVHDAYRGVNHIGLCRWEHTINKKRNKCLRFAFTLQSRDNHVFGEVAFGVVDHSTRGHITATCPEVAHTILRNRLFASSFSKIRVLCSTNCIAESFNDFSSTSCSCTAVHDTVSPCVQTT